MADLFPVMVGGSYWKGASSAGAYCALLGGPFGVCATGPILGPIQARIPAVHSAHITLLTFAISLIGFVAGSLLFPDQPMPANTPR